jgi:hypothetical protein
VCWVGQTPRPLALNQKENSINNSSINNSQNTAKVACNNCVLAGLQNSTSNDELLI